MTEPIPARVTDHLVVRRGDEVIEATRVVEYACPLPPVEAGRAALPCGEHPYDPACCSPMAASGMELDGWAPARKALPPASPTRVPWWRRWLS